MKIAMDLMGPFPSGETLFVVTDYYSRYVEVEIMHSTSAAAIIEALSRIFATHGLPYTIVSDNGPQFTSNQFADFMKTNGIYHSRTTPYWPQANGLVERQNRTLLKAIRTAHSEGRNWKSSLYTYLLAYRTTPHAVTGKSPAEILFGRKPRTKMPEIGLEGKEEEDRDLRSRDQERKERSKRLAKVLKIELDHLGFFKERDPLMAPLETNVEGIYLCGGATGPIDIAESVVQASAASMKAILH
jgi:transposase InsO family protein